MAKQQTRRTGGGQRSSSGSTPNAPQRPTTQQTSTTASPAGDLSAGASTPAPVGRAGEVDLAQSPTVTTPDAQSLPESVESELAARYVRDATPDDPMWASFSVEEKMFLADQAGVDVTITGNTYPNPNVAPTADGAPTGTPLTDPAGVAPAGTHPTPAQADPTIFDGVGAPANPDAVNRGSDLPIDGTRVHTSRSFREGGTTGLPVDENTAKHADLYTGLPQPGVPEGIIIEPDEEARFEGEVINGRILVTQDVYRKHYPRGSSRPTYVKLYNAGSYVNADANQMI